MSDKPNMEASVKDIEAEIRERSAKALEYQRRRDEARAKLLALAQRKPDTVPDGSAHMTQQATAHAHPTKQPRGQSRAVRITKTTNGHAPKATKGRGNKDGETLYLGIRNIRRGTWDKIQAFVEAKKGTEAKTNAGTVISDAVDQWLAGAAKRGPGRPKKTE